MAPNQAEWGALTAAQRVNVASEVPGSEERGRSRVMDATSTVDLVIPNGPTPGLTARAESALEAVRDDFSVSRTSVPRRERVARALALSRRIGGVPGTCRRASTVLEEVDALRMGCLFPLSLSRSYTSRLLASVSSRSLSGCLLPRRGRLRQQ